MKTKATIAVLSYLLVFNTIANPLTDFRLEAKIEGKAEYAKGNSKSKTQRHKIEAVINNTSDQESESTVVKWVIYGHSLEDKQMILIKSGGQKITVPAQGAITVNSPEIKISGNREYKVSKRSRDRAGHVIITTKKVPASGQDYYGYSVEVFSAGKLMASYYSQPSIEKDAS